MKLKNLSVHFKWMDRMKAKRYEIRTHGAITIFDRRKKVSYWMDKKDNVQAIVDLLNKEPEQDALEVIADPKNSHKRDGRMKG